MFDNRGLPDYPPPINAWQFPPPPVSPRWKWAAIAAGVFGLVGGATMLTIAIAVGSSGAPGLIDDTELTSYIEDECALMTDEVESMPRAGSPKVRAATIADQNDAVEDMLLAIRDLGPEVIDADPPTDEWLADWDRLVEAREAFAENVLDGSVRPLKIPNDEDGDEIYLRMNDVFFYETTCKVPWVLLHP